MKTEFQCEIKIRYPSGSMVLYRDVCFPASHEWLKKVLKVVRMDWKHEKEILEDLRDYLEFNKQRLKDQDPKKSARYGRNLDLVLKRLEVIT